MGVELANFRGMLLILYTLNFIELTIRRNMEKTLFLLSHSPIPRFVKRMSIASQVSKGYLIYWDRDLKKDILFTIPNEIQVNKILLPAPQGKALKRLLKLILFIPKALKKIIKIKPNTIHVGNLDMLLVGVLYKVLFYSKVEIIYEIGDLPNLVFKKSLFSKAVLKIEKVLIRKISIIILTSPYFYSEYYIKLIPKEKVLIIPNVPSVRLITKEKSLGLQYGKGGDITIGFIGSVRYKEELLELINVSPELGLQVQISGVGKDFEELFEYSKGLGNINFTGPYDYKGIEDLYSRIDLVYSVYNVEKANVKLALPNRLYEAILFEKPILVAKNTILADFVEKYDIGFAVGKEIQKDLKIIADLIKNEPEVLLRKSKNCKAIKDSFIYEKYETVVRELYI